MKNLLLTCTLFATIAMFTFCSGPTQERIVLKTEDQGFEKGIKNGVFFAPGIEERQRESYLYFFSEDSCFSKHSGLLTGFVLQYELHDDSVTVHFTDRPRGYRILGNQVLMAPDRSFFRAKDFQDAFTANKMELF